MKKQIWPLFSANSVVFWPASRMDMQAFVNERHFWDHLVVLFNRGISKGVVIEIVRVHTLCCHLHNVGESKTTLIQILTSLSRQFRGFMLCTSV